MSAREAWPLGLEVLVTDPETEAEEYGLVVGYDEQSPGSASSWPCVLLPLTLGQDGIRLWWFTPLGERIQNIAMARVIAIRPERLRKLGAAQSGGPCACSLRDLMVDGCKCGAIGRHKHSGV